MDSNTHSTQPPGGQPPRPPSDDLAALAAVADQLASQDLDRLSDGVRAERVLVLRRLVDRLEGQWLKELAGLDALGAAGAEADQQIGSTAAWLRNGSAWTPGPPPARCGPPGPCSAARWRPRPRP